MKKTSKKKLLFFTLFFILFMSLNFVYADTSSKISFCEYGGVVRTFKIIGILINIVKVVVPILIIITAIINISKTILSGKKEDLKANFMQLTKQIVAGLIIFYIPTALDFAFDNLAGDGTSYDPSGFAVCTNCLFDTEHCKIPEKDPNIYTTD